MHPNEPADPNTRRLITDPVLQNAVAIYEQQGLRHLFENFSYSRVLLADKIDPADARKRIGYASFFRHMKLGAASTELIVNDVTTRQADNLVRSNEIMFHPKKRIDQLRQNEKGRDFVAANLYVKQRADLLSAKIMLIDDYPGLCAKDNFMHTISGSIFGLLLELSQTNDDVRSILGDLIKARQHRSENGQYGLTFFNNINNILHLDTYDQAYKARVLNEFNREYFNEIFTLFMEGEGSLASRLGLKLTDKEQVVMSRVVRFLNDRYAELGNAYSFKFTSIATMINDLGNDVILDIMSGHIKPERLIAFRERGVLLKTKADVMSHLGIRNKAKYSALRDHLIKQGFLEDPKNVNNSTLFSTSDNILGKTSPAEAPAAHATGRAAYRNAGPGAKDYNESGEMLKIAINQYVDQNEDNLSETLGKATDPLHVRVPIEGLIAIGKDNAKDFLTAIMNGKGSNSIIEIYSPTGKKDVNDATYHNYGIEKQVFDGENSNTNTLTLYLAGKGDDLGSKSDIMHRIGGMDPEKTILMPIGYNDNEGDKTGVIRSTVMGLRLIKIARDLDNGVRDDIFIRKTIEQFRSYCNNTVINKFDIDPKDIIDLATGKFNKVRHAIKKILRLLPITPIETKELREVYEHARTALIAA